MSWNVFVFEFDGPPPRLEELTSELRGKSMGTREEVRARISAHLPGVDWSDPTWGVFDVLGYSFELSVRAKPQIEGFLIHVRGSGDAIGGLLQFARPNGWSLFDCTACAFLDPENPSDEGWKGFQEFRDKVVAECNIDGGSTKQSANRTLRGD